MILNENIKMNNGKEIPKMALGTWFIEDDKVADAVRAAVNIGYRHIDTAQAYGNERGVGEGVYIRHSQGGNLCYVQSGS